MSGQLRWLQIPLFGWDKNWLEKVLSRLTVILIFLQWFCLSLSFFFFLSWTGLLHFVWWKGRQCRHIQFTGSGNIFPGLNQTRSNYPSSLLSPPTSGTTLYHTLGLARASFVTSEQIKAQVIGRGWEKNQTFLSFPSHPEQPPFPPSPTPTSQPLF